MARSPMSPRPRECKGCSATFTATARRHFYCSPACGRAHYPSSKQVPRSCEACGKCFLVRARSKTRFCSPACGTSPAMIAMRPSLEEQEKAFWGLVEKMDTGCWEWRGAISPLGYGLPRNTPSVPLSRAHRVAWFFANGRLPDKGLEVCHSCDNPPCCNPAHLWLGTHRENMEDARDKNRWKRDQCKRGHPLSGDNLSSRANGVRVCKACKRLSYVRNREAINAKRCHKPSGLPYRPRR